LISVCAQTQKYIFTVLLLYGLISCTCNMYPVMLEYGFTMRYTVACKWICKFFLPLVLWPTYFLLSWQVCNDSITTELLQSDSWWKKNAERRKMYFHIYSLHRLSTRSLKLSGYFKFYKGQVY